MAALLTEMTGDPKSLQEINTSLDDDSIIDILNSSKLQRYFGVEIESQLNGTRKNSKKKIKQLFNNNQRHKGIDKSQRRTQRVSYKPNTKYPTNTTENITNKNPKSKSKRRHKRHKQKYGRSKSVPRIQTQQIDFIKTSMATPQVNDNAPKKIYRLASWFEKLNYTPSKHNHSNTNDVHSKYVITPTSSSVSNNYDMSISAYITRNSIQRNSVYRPSLKDIYADKQLLEALIAFMERIYCEENILFLQAVQQFKCKIDQYIACEEKQAQFENNLSDNIKRDIDFQIVSIYNAYIVSNAQYQVNLSYDCFMNSLSRREAISTITLHQKREIFDICVDEIERLILSSVLSPFYDSAEFTIVAQQITRKSLTYNRNYKNHSPKKKSRNPFTRRITHSPSPKQHKSHFDDLTVNADDIDSDFDDLINNNYMFDDEYVDDLPYPRTCKSLSHKHAHAATVKLNLSHSTENYNKVISPISTTNDTSSTSIAQASPLSLSQSKSEQFDLSASFCSAPKPFIIRHKHSDPVRLKYLEHKHKKNMDEHVKTASDGQILSQFKIQKLKDKHNINRKKYTASKTKVPGKMYDKKVRKRRGRKKEKKVMAVDDGGVKRRSKNKIKKLKKIKKMSLRKRRKSGNDSDILLKLYRDKSDTQENNSG